MIAVAGAVDIGGTNTRVALIREDGAIIAMDHFSTPRGPDPLKIPSAVESALRTMMDSTAISSLRGIGISAAGPVDQVSGRILHPPNMAFEEVPVAEPLISAFGFPVFLMNDCSAAVLGEVFFGAGIKYRHVVYITFSTGIGGGVYSDGRILAGRGGNAAEIGHFYVDTTYLHPCSCGHAGHWEGYASGRGIPGFFQTWCSDHGIDPGFPCRTADDILSAAARQEPAAGLFIHALARINGRGLSSVIVAYDPEIIILDGPVITAHPDLILTPALAHLDRYLATPEIVISPLEGKAPLLGVAAAVCTAARQR